MAAQACGFSFGPVGGDGPALLCIHGLTGVPEDVRPSRKLSDALRMACVGPLLPGHGTSPGDLARTRRAQWTSALRDVYDELAATHACVYVLGFSLGGVLALELCRHRPVAAALVLAAPLDLGFVRRTAACLGAPLGVAVRRRRRYVDRAAASGDRGYPVMPLRAVRELMALQREVRRALAEIRTPLRLLYSRRDPTVRLSDADFILREAGETDVELEVLERSGHMLPRDVERDRVAAWICEQLTEFEVRRGGG